MLTIFTQLYMHWGKLLIVHSNVGHMHATPLSAHNKFPPVRIVTDLLWNKDIQHLPNNSAYIYNKRFHQSGDAPFWVLPGYHSVIPTISVRINCIFKPLEWRTPGRMDPGMADFRNGGPVPNKQQIRIIQRNLHNLLSVTRCRWFSVDFIDCISNESNTFISFNYTDFVGVLFISKVDADNYFNNLASTPSSESCLDFANVVIRSNLR